MSKPNQFQILHISDLHVSDDKTFDRSVVLDPLIERVREDKKACLNPEIVIVSGDIANTGVEAEYQRVKVFFVDLRGCLGLPRTSFFMVPGNHDVYRDKYRPTDVPVYSTMKELNDELENGEYRRDLLKGMEEYFKFIDENYPHLKSKHEQLIPFVHSYQAKCGKRIGLVGLNSAWMCRKSPDREKIAIGEYQVIKAAEALNRKKDLHLKINICHHPLNWLWLDDRMLCQRHFNNSVLLCGHLHETEGWYIEGLKSRMYQFQAGGAYLGSDSKRPSRFHYITFCWEDNRISLDFRKFDGEKHQWCVDGEAGKDGKKDFPMMEKRRKKKGKDTPPLFKKQLEQYRVFKDYNQYMLNEHRHLPTQGFETNFRHPIEIERVYVNMHAYLHGSGTGCTIEGRTRIEKRIRDEQLSSLDIKGAFHALERSQVKDMVILGDPGSGKTTLLKYILMMLLEGKAHEKLGINTDIIPFFGPLRELKDPKKERFFDYMRRVCCFEKYKVSDKDFTEVLEEGRGIILLDGLDEVADKETRIETCKWIDEARKELVHTRFVVTSRYAGYLGKSRLEGNSLELSIRDFTPDEVEEFLVRWFDAVETALHPGEDEASWKEKGRADALALVDRINQNQSDHIRRLAVNPLLLQIIALVHRDRGTLPQRRVELYDECTNVLLEKWDIAKGLGVLLTAREARQVLQPLAYWLHEEDERRSAPIDEIVEVIRGPLEEMGKSDIDSKDLLRNIRDRSGIFMGYSETEYGFAHLSFQEYLTAEEIRNTSNIEKLIEKYGDKWWREVCLLCLGLNNPSIIEGFMKRIIFTDHFKTDIALITDSLQDSIKKPSQPFIDAVYDKNLAHEARHNAVRVLKQIPGDKPVKVLRDIVKSEDTALAGLAFETLEFKGESPGVQKPSMKDTPAIITNEIDNSKMALIPAGTFLFGSKEDDKFAESKEKPQRVIDLPRFYMDVYPVTNEQFSEFLNLVRPDRDTLREWIDLDSEFRTERCRIKRKGKDYVVERRYEDHPVIYVTWHGADEYARWVGKRLPTEQEWEKAARGTDARTYPWGDRFKALRCNTVIGGIEGTSKVDRFPDGKSSFACYDMAGNVWEWTQSWYDDEKTFKVLRGGSWDFDFDGCRCAMRYYNYPYFRNFNVGFRCART